jgi:hypothetical protein
MFINIIPEVFMKNYRKPLDKKHLKSVVGGVSLVEWVISQPPVVQALVTAISGGTHLTDQGAIAIVRNFYPDNVDQLQKIYDATQL